VKLSPAAVAATLTLSAAFSLTPATTRAEVPASVAPAKGAVVPATPGKTVVTPAPAATPGEDIPTLIKTAPNAADFPNAAKATLLDLSDIVVRPNGSAKTYVRETEKIFNTRGRDEESEIKIPYNSTYETVTILRARTIKPDGSIIPVNLKEVRDETVSQDAGAPMYTDAREKSFSMPAVDSDCIIDYEYIIDQKESQIPGKFWTQWYFQSGLDPVKLSRLIITLPKTMTLQQRLLNTGVKAVVTDQPDGKSVRYVWQDHDVTPLEPEPMMPSAEKVLPSLHVSTVPNWQSVADWYADLAKDREVPDQHIKDLVANLTAGKTTPEEKAKAIYYYVEQKTRYVSLDFGKSAFQPHHASVVCTNQYGDCKDMANLLDVLLHEAGIKSAYTVLLNANSKAKLADDLPSPGAFDHAICLAQIGGKDYWLDATAEVCPWGQIPGGDRGAQVFVIRDGGKGEWETIPDGLPDDNRTDQSVKLTLSPDGSASGTVTLSGTGDVDMSLRGALQYLPPDKLRPYMESIAQNIGTDPRVTNVKLSDFKDLDKPVQISMDVTFPAWANDSDDVLIFKARPEQSKGQSSSPFREDTRRLSIEQNSAARSVSVLEVTLPTGSDIISLPKDKDIKSQLGQFTRTVARNGNLLRIETQGVNFRADVPAFQYNDIRQYYHDYLRAFDQWVIIKKK
jgi:hypothetical protein